MPHGNTDSAEATAQNAATDPQAPADQGEGSAPSEARSYAAADGRDSSLAAPAAGEVGDYADLGEVDDEALGGQQGRTNTNREAHSHNPGGQGPKTVKANRDASRSGSPDQGTQ